MLQRHHAGVGPPFCRVDGGLRQKLYGPGWGVPSTGVSLIEPGTIPDRDDSERNRWFDTQLSCAACGLSGCRRPLTATWLVDGSVIRVDSAVHGGVVRFNYTVPASGAHSVELRVTDSTPPLTLGARRAPAHLDGAAGQQHAGVSIRGHRERQRREQSGGITCGSTCTLAFASPTSVTLTATPAGGSVFVGWLWRPFGIRRLHRHRRHGDDGDGPRLRR